MDQTNLQMNQFNANGGEFALRVALCDLVQRLKRSEFMCKYLEQCRNELANEVIKLRSHVNILLRELVENLQKNNILNQNSQNFLDQLDQKIADQNDYKRSVKLDLIADESWEEITNRLINQLKKEISTAKSEEQHQLRPNDEIQDKKSTHSSSGSNYFDLKSDQNNDNLVVNEINEYETQEKHMAINDLNDVKVDDMNRKLKETKDFESDQDNIKLTYKLLENYSLMNANNNLKVIEVHEKQDRQRPNIHDILKEYLEQDKQTNQFDLVTKILHNYNLDLEEITRHIMAQNDKLIKLKGKQIRNYFRKQLDINKANSDQTSELKIKDQLA